MHKYIGLVILGLVLTACDRKQQITIVPSPIAGKLPLGITEIAPSSSPKIGRLYFSGAGNHPKFVTTEGVVFNSLCYDDYAKDSKLKKIDDYVVEDSVVFKNRKLNQDLEGNASVTVKKLSIFKNVGFSGQANRNRTYSISTAKQCFLLDEGVEIVKSEIGDNCKKTITQYKEQGRDVILILSAVRADEIKDVTNYGAGGSVDILGRGGGGTWKNDATETYVDIYLGVSLNEML